MRKLNILTCTSIILVMLTTAVLTLFFRSHRERAEKEEEPTIRAAYIGDAFKKISIATTNVSKHLHSVLILKEINGETYPEAIGAQFDGDGTIVTCAHAFWEDGQTMAYNPGPWNFYFLQLQPFRKELQPISELREIPMVKGGATGAVDVVLCIPGKVKPIHSLKKPAEITDKYKVASYHVLKSPELVRSTLTGAQTHIIGNVILNTGFSGYIMDTSYKDIESGSVFVDASGKNLYVPNITIRRSEASESVFKLFKINEDKQEISMCSAVELQ